jgi:hypothetical protein
MQQRSIFFLLRWLHRLYAVVQPTQAREFFVLQTCNLLGILLAIGLSYVSLFTLQDEFSDVVAFALITSVITVIRSLFGACIATVKDAVRQQKLLVYYKYLHVSPANTIVFVLVLFYLFMAVMAWILESNLELQGLSLGKYIPLLLVVDLLSFLILLVQVVGYLGSVDAIALLEEQLVTAGAEYINTMPTVYEAQNEDTDSLTTSLI